MTLNTIKKILRKEMSFYYGNNLVTTDPQRTGYEYKKWGPLFTKFSGGDSQQKYMIMNRMPYCNYPLREAIPDCALRKKQFPSHIDQTGVAYENNKM